MHILVEIKEDCIHGGAGILGGNDAQLPLLLENLNDFIDHFFKFRNFQATNFVKNNTLVSSKNSIRTDIALMVQRPLFKIIYF